MNKVEVPIYVPWYNVLVSSSAWDACAGKRTLQSMVLATVLLSRHHRVGYTVPGNTYTISLCLICHISIFILKWQN